MHWAAAVFDIGDVFFDATVWRRWLADRLARDGADVTYDRLVCEWETLLVDVYCGRAEYWDRFDALLERFGVPRPDRGPLADEARAMGKAVQKDRPLFPGVHEGLAALRQAGVKIVALSDTESPEARVRAMLADLGIEQYFDAVVTSRDIGFAKPQAEAYAAAAAAAGVDVGRCAFVGHDAEELAGAAAAGMLAVAFNYPQGVEADARAKRFGEIPALLGVRR